MSLQCSLKPATRYYYMFGSDNGGWSEERVFMSAPIPGPELSIRILAYGGIYDGALF